MKYLLVLTLLSMLFGCEDDGAEERNIERNKSFEHQIETGVPLYKIVVIDSCEYIETQYYNANASLTHKGNCKFCKQRAQQTKHN